MRLERPVEIDRSEWDLAHGQAQESDPQLALGGIQDEIRLPRSGKGQLALQKSHPATQGVQIGARRRGHARSASSRRCSDETRPRREQDGRREEHRHTAHAQDLPFQKMYTGVPTRTFL